MVGASTQYLTPDPRDLCFDEELNGNETEELQHSDRCEAQPALQHAARSLTTDELGHLVEPALTRSIHAPKRMPLRYEHCNVKDLVLLISSMLMESIRSNDLIPLNDGHLTRFHACASPSISVHEYLQRLAMHLALYPSILLSMVYYIDRLCASYPALTISSLTVHRLLIATATVASKYLRDGSGAMKTYARIGGVVPRELVVLEFEFLRRVEWKIVPHPGILEEFYLSLVQHSEGYEVEGPLSQGAEGDK